MKNRQFHLLIVSLISIGPFVTLIAWLFDIATFTFWLFPIPVSAFVFWDPTEGYKEMRYLGLLLPLFMMKVFMIGIISLVTLYRKQYGGILLTRFYFLVLIISAVKLIGILLVAELDLLYLVASCASLTWIVFLIMAIRRHRTDLVLHSSNQNPASGI